MSAFDNDDGHGAIDDEALGWALRMAEPGADWDGFTAWLEAQPDRADRYDRAVAALEVATQVVEQHGTAATSRPIEELAPRTYERSRTINRRNWLSGALAAAILGTVGLGVWRDRNQTYTVATAAGEQRTISLRDGSSVVLAGGSQIRLDKGRPRSAVLDTGSALFRIQHQAGDPFHVKVQDLALTDLGTVFDVRVLGSRTHVAVAEGAVMVEGGGAQVRLDPGQSVVAGDGRLRRKEQDVDAVGSWREGRLTYDDATMSEVAQDLTRQLGRRITAAPAVAGRRFNGTLEIWSFRNEPAVLGSLLGVSVKRDEDGWTLDASR